MALSIVATFTGTTVVGGATAATQPGDIFLAFAFRTGNTTAPSLPAGWGDGGSLGNATTTSRSARLGYLHAADTGSVTDLSGVWTNATAVIAVQMRPNSGKGLAIGTQASVMSSGQSTAPSYGGVTLIGGASQDKYVLSFAGATLTTTNIDSVVPTSSTAVVSHIAGGVELAAFATSSPVSTWATNAPTITPTVPWMTSCIEMFEYTPVVYGDDFDRANANLGASLAATGANSGWSWTDSSGGNPGAATIASNNLNANTTFADGYLFQAPDIGHRDHYLEFTCGANGANSSFLDLRVTDIGNKLSIRQNATSIDIFRRVATTYTSIYSTNHSLVAGDVIRLHARNNGFLLFKNGTQIATGAIGAVLNGTKVGLNPRTAVYANWLRDVKFGSNTPPAAPPAGGSGKAKIWSGSAWVEKPAKTWSGSAWVTKPVKVWTGSAWKTVGGAAGPTAPTSTLLLTYTPGTDRNDFTGEVGVRLGIGTTAIPITWLGARRHHVDQTGVHTLKLYEWFSGLVERTATIDYTGVAVGSYAWGAITPHTLGANGYYALLMPVTAYDGQTWCNPGAVTYKSPEIVNIYDSYYSGGLQTGGPNACFIGVDVGS